MLLTDKKYALEKAVVVLYHPVAHTRAMLRSVVMGLGFAQVQDYSELRPARTAITDRGADLVLLDLDNEGAAVTKLMRDIRIRGASADPYVPIIGFSWSPDLRTVNSGLEAGVDDVVAMPISHKVIAERINVLIENRKAFIVTASYVGPDRRTGARGQEDELGLGTITVPNNLRFKATGDADAMASESAIATTQASIDHHRLNRYAQRICWLVDQIRAGKVPQGKNPGTLAAERHDEIAYLIESMAFDLKMQGHSELLEITDSMQRVLDVVRATPRDQYYEFLVLHAKATNATLMAREGAQDMVAAALRETASYLDRVTAA